MYSIRRKLWGKSYYIINPMGRTCGSMKSKRMAQLVTDLLNGKVCMDPIQTPTFPLV